MSAVDSDVTGPESAALAGRLLPHLLTAPPDTALDLGAARTLDSTGVDLLAAARTYATHRGCALHIINAAPCVQRALLAAGVHSCPANAQPESTTASASPRPAPRQLFPAVTA